MSTVEQIPDAEVVEETETTGREVVRHEATALSVKPEIAAGDLVERLETIRGAMEDAMVQDIDYGKVPGTNKPTLLKPGAEKLGVLFQLDIQIDNQTTWGPGDHLTVVAKAVAYHAPTGARLGYGEGLCTTREKKYAKRRAGLKCPTCEKENIRKSKKGDGFYCWDKTGGCGGQFKADDKRIVDQVVGEIENPDLPDVWNTVIKMAEKRARVDAVLAVTGASALFTQDLDEQVERKATEISDESAPATPAAQIASMGLQTTMRKAIAFLMEASVNTSIVSDAVERIADADAGRIAVPTASAVIRLADSIRSERTRRLQATARRDDNRAADEASSAAKGVSTEEIPF